jgi:carboxyl-terminal processing protease
MMVLLATGLVIVGMGMSSPVLAQQENPAAELARVEDLKYAAFQALKTGQFDRTSDLLNQAQEMSRDPALATMKTWLADYQGRLTVSLAERKKEYDEAVVNLNKLKEAGLETYASDAAAAAYQYAADKEDFRKQPWVSEVIARSHELATVAEQNGDWMTARRLYSDLSAIEPINPAWRTKINDVSRRLTLLAIYAPDQLEAVYKADSEARKQVAQIIDPEKAATKPSDDIEMNPDFRLDWKQMLQGVKLEMMRDAMKGARDGYYRETAYPELVGGGVAGLQLLISTNGLEKTFPALADANLRKQFADALDAVKRDSSVPDRMRTYAQLSDAVQSIQTANAQTLQLPDEVILYEFTNGALSTLDPFTNVIWPFDLPEFIKSTQGNFVGVGIQIANDDEGFLKVVSPLPDSPAMKAGILADDRVIKINGKSAKGVTTTQAVKAITGREGSQVTLTIESPDGNTKELTLTRAKIDVASVKGWSQKSMGSWDFMIDQDTGIGYIRLTNFTRESAHEVETAIKNIKDAHGKAIILDLRANPGGLLTAATEIADQFLPGGNIVSTRTASNVETSPPVDARPSRDDVTMPTVVLVNQYSASASEIVSGALKDHKRALIVGERTFGKGSVQMLYPIARNEAFLKLTTSHYYLPSGRCLHREEDSVDWGVDPDVSIDMTPEEMRNVLKLRQDMDVLRSGPATNPTTLPSEFKSREEQLLASDPQLGAAVLLLKMQLMGAPIM